MAFWGLKGVYKHERNKLFTWVNNDRTRGNGFKLKEGGCMGRGETQHNFAVFD